MPGGNLLRSGSPGPSSCTISPCFRSMHSPIDSWASRPSSDDVTPRPTPRLGPQPCTHPNTGFRPDATQVLSRDRQAGRCDLLCRHRTNPPALPGPLAIAHRGSVQRQRLWLRGPTCAGSPSCPRRHEPGGPRYRSTGRHPPTTARLHAAERRNCRHRLSPRPLGQKKAPTLCSLQGSTAVNTCVPCRALRESG